MSHSAASTDTVDPNLTPLLDLVLQLLMLFMICGNYAAESNDPVSLAWSQTAKQLTDAGSTQPDQDYLFLTVKTYYRDSNGNDLASHIQPESRDYILPKYMEGDPYIIVPGHDAMKPNDELLDWLKKQYKMLGDKNGGQVNAAIVIRPEGMMDYAAVYRVLRVCKDSGFKTLKVRALIGKGVET